MHTNDLPNSGLLGVHTLSVSRPPLPQVCDLPLASLRQLKRRNASPAFRLPGGWKLVEQADQKYSSLSLPTIFSSQLRDSEIMVYFVIGYNYGVLTFPMDSFTWVLFFGLPIQVFQLLLANSNQSPSTGCINCIGKANTSLNVSVRLCLHLSGRKFIENLPS